VGIALSENIQNRNRVTSASVVSGVVRVSQVADAAAGLVLESHYFFVPTKPLPIFGVPAYDWGHGPFVAIVADTSGSNSVISAYALGWMVGLRQPTWDLSDIKNPKVTYSSTASWNFGVGLRIDPSVQVLGDGIVANRPLPAGETAVRFKNVAGYGVMLISSFSFD